MTAAERGDKYTVTRYVEKGIDINGLSTKRRYALPAAARKGRIFVVAYLLHMGCNVNIHSGSDGTALIASAENGHKDVVELMLTYGADAHVETPKYGSAAVAAQRKGHTEIVTIINHYIQTQNAQRNLFDAKMTAAAEITERGRRQLQENMRQSLDGQSKQKSQLEDGIARELKKAEEYRVVGSDAKMQPQFSNAWEKPQLASPVYAPPTLPAGWIAQWDKNTSLYYYVELSTGVSQWQVPTQFSTPGAGDNSLASRFGESSGNSRHSSRFRY